MHAMSNMASSLGAFVLLFLTLAVSLVAGDDAPSPAAAPPSGPLNVTDILKNATRYNTFIRLLKDTEVTSQVSSLVNGDRTNADGLTVLAPTDAAFAALRAGTLNRMEAQEQSELVLYHILPKYYSFVSFETTTNPVRTEASGQRGVCTVNVTTFGDDMVNVSSGLVETTLGRPIYSEFPLAVYPVDKVLQPPDLFGPNAKKHGAAAAPEPAAAAAATGKPGRKSPSMSSEAGAPDEAPAKEADTANAAPVAGRTVWPAFAGIVSAVVLSFFTC